MSEKSNYAKEKVFKALKSCKKSVWPIINEYINPKEIPSVSSLKMPEVEELFWKQIADYPLRGGKYVRSSLILLTCEALGGSRDDALYTAAAMEICQNWALIHDDIEDDSTKRRGEPALHRRYSVNYAINAGDGLHIMMWGVLSRNLEYLNKDLCLLIWKEFYDMMLRTVVGQVADLTLQNSLDLTLDDIYYIMDGKTGYYTIGGPMRLGAVIAGYEPNQDSEIFTNINEFGLNLGRAFQITDDLLDLTTDFEGLKEQGNDIQEGKRSVLIVKLLQKADQDDLSRIIKIMNKPQGTRRPEEIEFILTTMEKYGVFEETRTLAFEFAKKSQEILLKLPFNPDSKKIFESLIEFLVSRTF